MGPDEMKDVPTMSTCSMRADVTHSSHSPLGYVGFVDTRKDCDDVPVTVGNILCMFMR